MLVGHRFEALVSSSLSDLGVRHQRMAPQSKADVVDKIDFLVWSRWCSKPFEVQLTLRRKEIVKIQRFVEASLVTYGERGTRLYVEVIAGHGQHMEAVALRVAKAIRVVVTKFRNFGPLDMLGIRVHASGGESPDKFHLHECVGLAWIRSRLPHIELERERRRMIAEARAAAQRELARIRRLVPFWSAFRAQTPALALTSQPRSFGSAYAFPTRANRYPLRLM